MKERVRKNYGGCERNSRGTTKHYIYLNFKLQERVSQDLHKYEKIDNCLTLEGCVTLQKVLPF